MSSSAKPGLHSRTDSQSAAPENAGTEHDPSLENSVLISA
jgi:hypothetical protein